MNERKGYKQNREQRWYSTDECYRELRNAIVIQATNDWKDGLKRLWKNPMDTQGEFLKCHSECFFYSEWYAHMCDYPVKDLMEKLPEMAKAELLETTQRKFITAYKRIKKLTSGKSTKSKQKNISLAVKQKNEAEDEMRSTWFINLYHVIPEEMIADCELMAEEEMRIEEANKRRTHEEKIAANGLARKLARERKMKLHMW